MFVRSLLALALLTVIVPVAAALAAPQWVEAVGLDVWHLPALHSQLADANEAARNMEVLDEDIQQRIEVKERLVEQLIAGQTTLAEVTAQFLMLDRGRPANMKCLRLYHHGVTDEERMARNVISFVLPRLANDPPSRKAEVTARLEAELRRFVGGSAQVQSHP